MFDSIPPLVISFIGFGLFFFFVFLRMPIAFAFLVSGFIGLLFLKGFDVSKMVLGLLPYPSVANYTMVALPLFILMGQFAYQSGISSDLYYAAYKWLGGLPGGLAIATNIACAGFAACTGSSLASTATMSTIALPEMRKLNYDMKLATGSVASAATLGILIPPSTMFIIYGYLTEQSVGKLFIAGILPGILLTVLFVLVVVVLCNLNPGIGPKGEKFRFKEAVLSLKNASWMLALFILIIGGMYIGVFTASEAGAAGAFGAFLIALARHRLSWKTFFASIKEAAEVSCYVLTILIGATIFTTFLVHAGFQATVTEWVTNLNMSRYLILSFILFLYIPMGMFMDTMAMLLLTVPIFTPVIVHFGFDTIWFGVVVVMLIETALISPPMGVNAFIVSAIAPDIPLKNIFIGIVPYLITILVCIVLIVIFPQIALFLPSIM